MIGASKSSDQVIPSQHRNAAVSFVGKFLKRLEVMQSLRQVTALILEQILGKSRKYQLLHSTRWYRLFTRFVGTGNWGEIQEDYDAMYGWINYDLKTVLDIGADWGSTAKYFLLRGARQVVAVECSQSLYSKLVKTSSVTRRVIPVFKCIGSGRDFAELIDRYHPDIVKVDCEGCEKNLSNLEDSKLKEVDTWIVEAHGRSNSKQLRFMFRRAGLKVRRIQMNNDVDILVFTIR